jgi:hypothetical protein
MEQHRRIGDVQTVAVLSCVFAFPPFFNITSHHITSILLNVTVDGATPSYGRRADCGSAQLCVCISAVARRRSAAEHTHTRTVVVVVVGVIFVVAIVIVVVVIVVIVIVVFSAISVIGAATTSTCRIVIIIVFVVIVVVVVKTVVVVVVVVAKRARAVACNGEPLLDIGVITVPLFVAVARNQNVTVVIVVVFDVVVASIGLLPMRVRRVPAEHRRAACARASTAFRRRRLAVPLSRRDGVTRHVFDRLSVRRRVA